MGHTIGNVISTELVTVNLLTRLYSLASSFLTVKY